MIIAIQYKSGESLTLTVPEPSPPLPKPHATVKKSLQNGIDLIGEMGGFFNDLNQLLKLFQLSLAQDATVFLISCIHIDLF